MSHKLRLVPPSGATPAPGESPDPAPGGLPVAGSSAAAGTEALKAQQTRYSDGRPGTLDSLVLGLDWKQRLRTLRSLGASAFYLLAVLLMHLGVEWGFLPRAGVGRLSLAIAANAVVFYALLRSGFNLRFKDAALTMPQMMAAVTFAALAYSMGGAPRDVVLMALVPLLWFGFRHLRALQIRLLSAYTLVALGVAMYWLVQSFPGQYDMGKEMVRFMIMAVMVVTLWQLTSQHVEEASGLTKELMRLVFTDDPKQRLRIQRSLVAAANFVIFTMLLAYAMRAGEVPVFQGQILGLYMPVQSLTFYVLLRSGLNLRFRDPALTLPQILSAIACVVGAYSILGDTRGASLLLLNLVLVFGMFNLTPRETRIASLFALALQGAAMLSMTTLAPERYPVRQELIHFLMVCTALPTISVLASQLASLRARLKARKDELTAALERIQTLATRDELTGLINRRHMNETLVLQKRFCDQGGRVFCIGLLDIDHFKRINDTHGHAVGDEVLRNFAAAVQGVLRDTDVVARWGGEEFLLMLTDCRLDQARLGLDRVHQAVNAAQMSAAHPDLRVSFSCGLTEQRYEEDLHVTIERADQALYRAKQRGRNRTTVA